MGWKIRCEGCWSGREVASEFVDPFCGATSIAFQVPERAEVMLAVLSPDSTALVQTLVHGLLDAGHHTVVWDQTDEDGSEVPDAVYAYYMSARSPEVPGILFESWRAATVSCAVSTVEETWDQVKARYHRDDSR